MWISLFLLSSPSSLLAFLATEARQQMRCVRRLPHDGVCLVSAPRRRTGDKSVLD